MLEHHITERLFNAARAVPDALVFAAASGICDVPLTPCPKCLQDVRVVLAYPYAFEPNASGGYTPGRGVQCVACLHSRWDGGETAACLFHQGADHWISREWLPPIPGVPRHRRSWWRNFRKDLLSFFKAPIA